MYSKKGLIIGATIGFLFVAGLDRVEAKEISFKGKFAGTSLHSRIDRNDDGLPANWSTGVTMGTLGKRVFQTLYEFLPTGPPAECPGGLFIIDAQNGFGTFT